MPQCVQITVQVFLCCSAVLWMKPCGEQEPRLYVSTASDCLLGYCNSLILVLPSSARIRIRPNPESKLPTIGISTNGNGLKSAQELRHCSLNWSFLARTIPRRLALLLRLWSKLLQTRLKRSAEFCPSWIQGPGPKFLQNSLPRSRPSRIGTKQSFGFERDCLKLTFNRAPSARRLIRWSIARPIINAVSRNCSASFPHNRPIPTPLLWRLRNHCFDQIFLGALLLRTFARRLTIQYVIVFRSQIRDYIRGASQAIKNPAFIRGPGAGGPRRRHGPRRRQAATRQMRRSRRHARLGARKDWCCPGMVGPLCVVVLEHKENKQKISKQFDTLHDAIKNIDDDNI